MTWRCLVPKAGWDRTPQPGCCWSSYSLRCWPIPKHTHTHAHAQSYCRTCSKCRDGNQWQVLHPLYLRQELDEISQRRVVFLRQRLHQRLHNRLLAVAGYSCEVTPSTNTAPRVRAGDVVARKKTRIHGEKTGWLLRQFSIFGSMFQ